MFETCNHCGPGVRALTLWWWEPGDDESYLCGNCSDRKAEHRVTIGWVLIHDERVESLQPRSAVEA